MKVSLKQHTHLIEGVFNGFTFTLLDEDLKSMHSPAQCKDYFQDLWWSEYNEKPASVYGFKWKPGTIDKKQPFYKFALKNDRAKELVTVGIISFLNYFEKALGFPLSTIEVTEEPNVAVLTFPNHWTRFCPMISAFTTIIRLGYLYDGGDVFEYLDKMQTAYKKGLSTFQYGKEMEGVPALMLADLGRYDTIRPRLKALAKGKIADPDWTYFKTGSDAHEGGIIGYTKFPEVK